MQIENNPLVSVITPCYNGEMYLDRFFNSILAQSYPNLEIFFVDDGSTDDTKNIALYYERLILEKGYSFHYLYRENGGIAAAINTALPLANGKYLTWPDSDDIMYPNCIEEKVNFLEKHTDCAVVCCSLDVVDESDIEKILYKLERKHFLNEKNTDTEMFIDMVKGHNMCYVPIHYLIRRDVFTSVVPSLQIADGRWGQNVQLLLPVFYKQKCGLINKSLGKYVIRSESDSHATRDVGENFQVSFSRENNICLTLDSLEIPTFEKKRYLDIVHDRYSQQRFDIAYNAKDIEYISEAYKII